MVDIPKSLLEPLQNAVCSQVDQMMGGDVLLRKSETETFFLDFLFKMLGVIRPGRM